MKSYGLWRGIVCLTMALGLAGSQTGWSSEPGKSRVILISLDGLANFYLDDPRAELPTIRRLAKEGSRAAGMVASFPTVTWPNHTTLVTGVLPGRHGVIGNNVFDRETGKPVPFIPDPLFDKSEIVKVPTIYDVASEKGLVTAGVIWPATRNAKTLHYTVPDMGGDDAWPRFGTPVWMEELRAAKLPVDKHGEWVRTTDDVKRDWLYTRLALHAWKHHTPHLMLVHLINVDHVQHKYGPRSDEAYWAVNHADDRVRDIVDAVAASPYAKETTIIVASDHGFFPIEHDIRLNVLFRQMAGDDQKPVAQMVGQGGGGMIFIHDTARKEEIIKSLRERIPAIDGVDAVFTAAEKPELGLSVPADDRYAPDLWVAAKPGYSFTDSPAGDDLVVPRATRAGTHGYLPDQPDMLATLVLSGAGISPGVDLGKVRNTDVTPTIARLLKLELPKVDGVVLTKALQQP